MVLKAKRPVSLYMDGQLFYIVTVKISKSKDNVFEKMKSFARKNCNCQGIEEFSINEDEIVKILGNQAYTVCNVSS